MTGTATVLRGDARHLPLADATVDLILTSPPYFGLRSYQDGGEHYAGQIGDEPTPTEFVDALIDVTRECVRVLKPSGSMWINLGDKYAGGGGYKPDSPANAGSNKHNTMTTYRKGGRDFGMTAKSLMGIPWRYALRCIDDLGLILRAEVIWSKPNGLPESVTDRVRRSHEQWFHMVLNPRYYSAVDEIREPHLFPEQTRTAARRSAAPVPNNTAMSRPDRPVPENNPLGKLPGSVWSVPTQPLQVPAHLGVDHFAAFPMEWPRRIIRGWSPAEVCTACGEGRRPVVERTTPDYRSNDSTEAADERRVSGSSALRVRGGGPVWNRLKAENPDRITGYACACPDTSAPATPGTVLDPFGGTGTTALVARALGRRGISVDMSADYCRLAEWRVNDPKELARAAQVEYAPPPPPIEGQLGMFEETA